MEIRKVAVIGSGVMGASIAAHLANVGIPVLLLDIVPKEAFHLNDKKARNRFGLAALGRLRKQKPAPLTKADNIRLIEVGNLEDDVKRIAEVDWTVEVVTERLDIKQSVFSQVDKYRKKGSIVSSNTSGISIHAMADGRSDDFKQHFLGTHFFNPPRYMTLLEVIPTRYTAPEVIDYFKKFGEEALGKGVVLAKDTPNFIANRIGTYGLQITVKEMLDKGYSVGEVDSITGPLIGRAKSATFRTLDVVGLDTYIHVADNVKENASDENERQAFEVPDFLYKMAEKGWIGSKAGQGFFLKKGKDILQLNPETLTYEPREKLDAPSVRAAKALKSPRQKLKALAFADDRAGTFLWSILKPMLLYSAEKAGEIADSIYAIDTALKWGFNWSYGPFETWDALGFSEALEKMRAEGERIPAWINEMAEKGLTSFYKEEHGETFYYHKGNYARVPRDGKTIYLHTLKELDKVIKENNGASLIDIGDDIAVLEIHSLNNALGPDVLSMIRQSVEEVEKNYKGLVLASESKHFCVGANLALMLFEAQDDNFFELDLTIRQFQETMLSMKYAARPVVAAPFSMTLGGGAEICLAVDAVQAGMESYIGLVETGVGLIPGGGGTKELYLHLLERSAPGISADVIKTAARAFELIATAKVSTSAAEAKDMGFIRPADVITASRDHLVYQAKQRALAIYEQGYRPPVKPAIPVAGESGYATMVMGAEMMKRAGFASDYDLVIGKKLAHVLSGGGLPEGTTISEDDMLNLEREAFLSLLGEPKTQERMQYMLARRKPLRN